MKYHHFLIRDLKLNDSQEIKKVLNNITGEFTKELFVSPNLEYIKTIISGYGYSAGIFFQETLIGFASIVFPKLGKNNMGHYLGFSTDELMSVAQLEHIYILPSYRGAGIAQKLIGFLIDKLNHEYTILLSAISPKNISSLSLAFKIKLKIVAFAELYNVNRFIMREDLLFSQKNYDTQVVEIPIKELNSIIEVLNQGYVGTEFNICKSSIIFKYWRCCNEKI